MTQPATMPDPMRSLARLVGSWRLSGGLTGTTVYEWAAGGHFLLQQLEGERGGHPLRGLEVIGREQRFGEAASHDVRSRFYSFTDGLTLDYVYELLGDTLTIWGGERGSPAFYRGQFSADGDTLEGEWVYPGGGYPSIATRTAAPSRQEQP